MKYLGLAFCSFILFLSDVVCVNGQGSILFMNGKEETGRFIGADSAGVDYEKHWKSKKKTVRYKIAKVFSVTKEDGSKLYVYEPDSFETEILSIEEMELFVYGLREAKKGYKAPLAFWEGFFCGITSGFVGAGVSPFYAPIPIAVNSIVTGQIKPKVYIEPVVNPNYFKKETFLAGYREEANFKKMKNITLGSIIGFPIGFAALIGVIESIKRDK